MIFESFRHLLPSDAAVCVWTETEECYETSCGKSFCMIEGSPKENDILFCCFCGKQLQEKRME